MCPGRRPTTGSRQKYSAAKTEVASESLPVAPFARPALLARSVSLTLMLWSDATTLAREVMYCNLENKRLRCMFGHTYVIGVTVTATTFFVTNIAGVT